MKVPTGKAFVPSGKPCCIFSDGKISASLSPKILFILVQLPDSFKDFAIPHTGGKSFDDLLPQRDIPCSVGNPS